MVAVIDPAAELGIQKRPAAAAGMLARFVEPDLVSLLDERDCGGETGETGPDHMHPARRRGFRRHSTPWRSTSHSFCCFDRLTRAPGSRQPERNSLSSIAR